MLKQSLDREKLAEELHHVYRRPPILLKVKVFYKDHIWSSDLVVMPKENQGRNGIYKYIITILDLYTRYAWAIPLKDKTGITITNAFQKIFKQYNRKPTKLWVDRGTEYYNKEFKIFYWKII